MLDADAECAHFLRQAGEIRRPVGPQFARFLCLRSAIGAVETALALIAATVVVDDRDRRDVPAHGRLDLGDMIPEARVAGENHDRSFRAGRLGADPRRKGPTEMTGTAYITLVGHFRRGSAPRRP